MSRPFLALALALALLALFIATAAKADRYGRGLTIFQQRQCTSCHSVGWGSPAKIERRSNTDLTRVTRSRSDDELRKFLADPFSVRRDSACTHRALSKDEIDDLLLFLHLRAEAEPGVSEVEKRTAARATPKAPSPPRKTGGGQ